MATKTKLCSRHGVTHPVTDFPKDKKQHDRLSTWCKLAWREYRAEKAGGKVTPKKAAAKPAGEKPVVKKAGKSVKAVKEAN